MKYFASKSILELAGILYCKIPVRKNKGYDLVLVRTDRIGDYVIWHDTIAAYKQKYHNKKVLLVCNDTVSSLAKEENFFTDLLTFNIGKIKKSPKYAFDFIRSLRTIKAGMLINSVWERIWYADVFSLAIKANEKIAIAPKKTTGHFINYYNKQYGQLFDCNECVSEISADEMFAQKAVWADYKYGNYPITVSAMTSLTSFPYAVVSFTTSTPTKNWPIERFIKVIDKIPEKYKIVLTGAGKYDTMCAHKICDQVANKDRIIDCVGKTTVSEMVSIIANSAFVLSNDSAAVHIAASTGIPSIAVLSGTHFNRFLPYPKEIPIKHSPRVVSYHMDCYYCEYNCVYPDKEPFECIKKISVEMVLKELDQLLNDITKSGV